MEPRGAARRAGAGQGAKHADIFGGFGRAIGSAVAHWEGIGIARSERRAPARIFAFGQLGLHRRGPTAHHCLQRGIKLGLVDRAIAFANIEHKADLCERAAIDRQAPIEYLCASRVFKQGLHLHPHFGRLHIARQPNKRQQMPRKWHRDQR